MFAFFLCLVLADASFFLVEIREFLDVVVDNTVNDKVSSGDVTLCQSTAHEHYVTHTSFALLYG